MWPFTGPVALWLVLYVLTFALHAVFASYVVAGAAYALVRRDDLAARTRDRLPFMLGLAITAGVAPLLFLQLLYQHRFYTANLILGARWGAVVPALIAGFYALYIAKAKSRLARAALGVGLACFVFVAWSWTELHLLMEDEPAWRAMYAAGERLYTDAPVAPRLVLWLGAMATLFAVVSLAWATSDERRLLAKLGLAGRAVSIAAALYLGAPDAATHGWLYVLGAALAAEAIGWIATWRAPGGVGPMIVTGAASAALIAATVVREAARLALLEPPRPGALAAGGLLVFLATLVIGGVAIGWVVRTVRRSD
jgi:hypothetical protein